MSEYDRDPLQQGSTGLLSLNGTFVCNIQTSSKCIDMSFLF